MAAPEPGSPRGLCPEQVSEAAGASPFPLLPQVWPGVFPFRRRERRGPAAMLCLTPTSAGVSPGCVVCPPVSRWRGGWLSDGAPLGQRPEGGGRAGGTGGFQPSALWHEGSRDPELAALLGRLAFLISERKARTSLTAETPHSSAHCYDPMPRTWAVTLGRLLPVSAPIPQQ